MPYMKSAKNIPLEETEMFQQIIARINREEELERLNLVKHKKGYLSQDELTRIIYSIQNGIPIEEARRG